MSDISKLASEFEETRRLTEELVRRHLELKSDFVAYAAHAPVCRMRFINNEMVTPCTCGFFEAMRKWTE